MRKLFYLAVVVLALLTAAWAVNTFASCPYDGESAQWTGGQKFGTTHSCEYAHSKYDSQSRRNVEHRFWQSCGD